MIKTGIFKFNLKTLYNNPNMSINDLLDTFKIEHPDIYSKKIDYHGGKDKTEKQLRAEIGSWLTNKKERGGIKIRDHFIKDNATNITLFCLSDEGKKVYNIIYSEDDDEDNNGIEITEDDEENKVGFIYLLKAGGPWRNDNVYKIGITQNIEVRLNQLKKDNRYGIFNFSLIKSFKINYYKNVEKIIQNKLCKYRVDRSKGCLDTEIFKGCENIEGKFVREIEELQKDVDLDFKIY